SPLARPVTAALRERGWQVHVLTLPSAASHADAGTQARALRTWEYDELAAAVAAVGRLDLAVQLAAAPAADWAAATRRLGHALLAAKAVQPVLVASAGEGRSAYLALTQLDGACGLAPSTAGAMLNAGAAGAALSTADVAGALLGGV